MSDVFPLVLFSFALYLILVVGHELDCRLKMQVSVSFRRERNDRKAEVVSSNSSKEPLGDEQGKCHYLRSSDFPVIGAKFDFS